ncbi:MAG: hypothetical protein PWP54_920 [Thermosipho sp. (in: thermotogales)]|nr:hypothetical protein [Thermosipho sp. (in: thermotogales)]MDN5325154.1 hypothetical protein [Thermosipho sp. (in: thermotogales)]
MVFAVSFSFSINLYEYKFQGITIYKSVGAPIDPFFDYDELKVSNWDPFEPELITIREGSPVIIIIHGISPKEINEKIDDYKRSMIESFKTYSPKNVGLYFYLYPTLTVKLEYSAKKLVEYTKKFDSFYIFAHSMGGILVRYALQDLNFQDKVKKVIFSGTPHRGSPLANFIILKKHVFNYISNSKIELIKFALITSNIVGGSIEAPNYRYLIFGKQYPVIPKQIETYNFVGILDFNLKNVDIMDVITSKISYSLGLMLLKYMVENIFPENSLFQINDGMVPYYSAIQDAKNNIVFHFTSHSDLAFRRDIIEKVLEIFEIKKGENNEK